MNMHAGSSSETTKQRSLHRPRVPHTSWEWIEKSYVILALIGMIFTALSFYVGGTFKEIATVSTVLVFFVLSSVSAIAMSIINGNKAKYAEVLEYLHQCAHIVRDLHLFVASNLAHTGHTDTVKQRLNFDLGAILDKLTIAYSLASSTKIQISLYFTRFDKTKSDKLGVVVVARDSASRDQWTHRDNSEQEDIHLIEKNTAFRSITEDDVNYYHSGDVSKNKDYKSSYFTKYPNDPKYKTILACPVRCTGATTDIDRYCGFLVIESMSENALNTRYDVDLGAAVADSLYMVLSNFAKKAAH